jgi:hypothetical protein
MPSYPLNAFPPGGRWFPQCRARRRETQFLTLFVPFEHILYFNVIIFSGGRPFFVGFVIPQRWKSWQQEAMRSLRSSGNLLSQLPDNIFLLMMIISIHEPSGRSCCPIRYQAVLS